MRALSCPVGRLISSMKWCLFFSSWPLTNISSVIHKLCPNRFHKDHASKFLGSILGKLTSTTKFWYIDRNPNVFVLFFLPAYIHNNPYKIFRCFYLPVFSSFLSYQELQGHLPFFTRFLPRTKWLPILSKELSLLKSFIFHQQAVLEWPNLLAEQVSLIKSYFLFASVRKLCVPEMDRWMWRGGSVGIKSGNSRFDVCGPLGSL